MRRWTIGDPVDWADGYADPYNWGRVYTDDEETTDDNEISSSYSKRDEYSDMAWDYYLDCKYEDALHYINLALDLDNFHANNWNKKAIILEYMERYEEAEKCYDKSLELRPQSLVYDNKARMLRNWAGKLLNKARESSNRMHILEEALEKNRNAINTLPGSNSEENIDNFLTQKRIIEYDINYEKEYLRNVESLKKYDKSELFTIAGRQFYNVNVNLTQGMSLKLIKEANNEFDKNAIAVYAEGEKVGYVANSDYTKFELTSSASELQNVIQNTAHGEFLSYLLRITNLDCPDIQFYIGRIIK